MFLFLCWLIKEENLDLYSSLGVHAPAVGGAEVTDYRIYYSYGGMLMNAKVPSTEHQYQLDLDGSLPDSMSVSIRAESLQLPSELITVTIDTYTEVPTTTVEELKHITTTTVTTTTTTKQSDVPTTEMPTTAILPASTVSIGDTTTNKDQLPTADVPIPSQST